MKIKIAVVFILTLFFVSRVFAYEDPKETELLFMAKKAYEDGFYEVSLGMLERFQKDYNESAKIPQATLLGAECYFYQGRYLEALNIFESLSNNPQADALKDELYFWMGEVHFKSNNFQKATLFYQKVINNYPQSSFVPAAYYSLGWSFSQTGEFNQVIQTFKVLMEKFPNEPQSKDAAFKLIECLYNSKAYAELKVRIAPVFKLYANDALRLPYLYFYLAESEYYLDNLTQAAKNYLKSAQAFKEPKVQALAKLGLGWSYLKLAKYKEAEEVLADIKSTSLDKKSLDILLLGQAVLMSATNRVYEARKLYEQLINLSGDPLISLQAYLGKADAHYNLAEYAQAVNVYQEGLDKIKQGGLAGSLPPELIDKLRYNLGLAYEGAGEFAKAEEIYAKIIKLCSDSSNAEYAQYQLASLQLKRLDYEAAVISFNLMLKKYPQSKLFSDALYALGEAYFQRADYVRSREIFVKFCGEFKDSPLRGQALYLLGTSLISLGKINEALTVFMEAAKLDPTDIELLQKVEYEIADCYYKIGQENEAAVRFKLLRAKYPNSKVIPDILWWLGQYYYRSNDLNVARRYFDSLIKEFPDSQLRAQAFYAMGLTFSEENKFTQAVDNFNLAIKLADSVQIADIRFSLAEALEASAELEAAIQQYQLAADLYTLAPQLFARSLLRVAKIYEDKENFKEALKIYKRIIEKTPSAPESGYVRERIDWIRENIKTS